jgi:predicted component of type VI protein secretion system
MHYALSIPELVAAIFKQIDDEDLRLWVDTLAALARTCRAFHPTALDTRWASVDDITWLLRLIPGCSHPSLC